MVVVGSRCQVRNRVLGWNAGVSTALSASATGLAGTVSAPNRWAPANPATDDARKARREWEIMRERLRVGVCRRDGLSSRERAGSAIEDCGKNLAFAPRAVWY